jgi:2-polyprenyl-3-methyl-5-hydroxy-6-metoxy-1,4-benzoquinol methylase
MRRTGVTAVDADRTNEGQTEQDKAKATELNGRVFVAAVEAIELATVVLGDRLGLYRALAERGPQTADELATGTAIHPRYAREWLEQQAVAGYIAVDEEGDEETRRYALPPAHAPVLLDPDHPLYALPLAELIPMVGKVDDQLAEAFRGGTGVPYAAYGIHDIQAGFTRPLFVNLLANEWVPGIPGLHERFEADPPAKVIEIGCGEGVAAITLATAYPKIRVDGFDLDEASIAQARRNAADAGVADRVTFEVRDVTDQSLTGSYDAAFAFEMVHDLARPVDALRTLRRVGADDGFVIVVDELASEEFEAPGDELQRFLYAASVVHCLPVGMVEQPSAGTGTVIRPSTVRRYAQDAGFAEVEILPIEHEFWRFYQLVP